jgi:hypothetical protein
MNSAVPPLVDDKVVALDVKHSCVILADSGYEIQFDKLRRGPQSPKRFRQFGEGGQRVQFRAIELADQSYDVRRRQCEEI